MKISPEERFFRNFISSSSDSCWIWDGSTNKAGYGTFSIHGKTTTAHRVSYEMFVQSFDKKLFVLHGCDNKLCVNPDHLFLGTGKDNTDDMVRKGRDRFNPNPLLGEDNPTSKLTEEDVIEIRRLEGQMSKKDISRLFGVSDVQIGSILRRKSWKHID